MFKPGSLERGKHHEYNVACRGFDLERIKGWSDAYKIRRDKGICSSTRGIAKEYN